MQNFLVDLNHLDLLAVKGPDSARFLQGQLTCDVNQASAGHSVYGAVCNNKGRMLSSFRLVNAGEDYYLEMQPGLLEANKANLDKYIVFFKAETEDARAIFDRLGVAGAEAETLLAQDFQPLPEQPGDISQNGGHLLIKLNNATDHVPSRYELWLAAGDSAAIRGKLQASLDSVPHEKWQLQDIRLGIYHVTQNDVEAFTPQALNYDLAGAVSFTKGCYTGQEIVARMYYRGTAKRRLYPVVLEGPDAPETARNAAVLRTDTGKKCGELLSLVPGDRENLYEGLAFLDTAAVEESAPLHLEQAPDTPLQARGLPSYSGQ